MKEYKYAVNRDICGDYCNQAVQLRRAPDATPMMTVVITLQDTVSSRARRDICGDYCNHVAKHGASCSLWTSPSVNTTS